jgi:hypothetical protein
MTNLSSTETYFHVGWMTWIARQTTLVPGNPELYELSTTVSRSVGASSGSYTSVELSAERFCTMLVNAPAAGFSPLAIFRADALMIRLSFFSQKLENAPSCGI